MVIIQSGSKIHNSARPEYKVHERIAMRYRPYVPVVGAFVAMFVGGVIIARYLLLPTVVSLVGQRFATRGSSPTPPTSVIIQRTPGADIKTDQIDQTQYHKIIQDAWDRALVEGATNVVSFTNDPNLIAFSYTSPGDEKPHAIVVYRNRPIIIRMKKVSDLPGGEASRVSLSAENYQLVVVLEYTDRLTAIDAKVMILEAFSLTSSQSISKKSP